jgi:TPR repeat protein
MLGWMHKIGRGVPKNLDESVRWFRLAAAQGNTVARDHLKYLEPLRAAPVEKPPPK